MLYSDDRKLALCGWLHENDLKSYESPLRLQKYLFFYEVFSKVEEENADFSRLKGYRFGPVFSSVWGDYTKERAEFDIASVKTYQSKKQSVNELRAKRTDFIVSSLSEIELSDLTHQYNVWKEKKQRILSGEKHVKLEESDFNLQDYETTNMIKEMYPDQLILNSTIISCKDKFFVFHKKDIKRLTEQHFDTIALLSEEQELVNPVFVEINEEGRLIVD